MLSIGSGSVTDLKILSHLEVLWYLSLHTILYAIILHFRHILQISQCVPSSKTDST